MRRFYLLTGILALGIPAAWPLSAQIPTTFTNLRVLPKDMSRAELITTMRNMASALGVRCTHCHDGPDDLQGMDFAGDIKPTKEITRTMLRMVRSINADFVTTMPAGETARQPVTCITCHRRATKPPRPLTDVLLATVTASGTAAAIEQYRKLRADMLDSGLYDFREPTLNIVATSLREQKKFAEAVEILRLNTEMFPKSLPAQINLGDTARQAGNLALAAEAYKRALQIDPANAAAKQRLESLKK